MFSDTASRLVSLRDQLKLSGTGDTLLATVVLSLLLGLAVTLLVARPKKPLSQFKASKMTPLLGNLPVVLRLGIIPSIVKWHQELGDIFRYRLGLTDTIVIADPDIVKDITTRKFKSFRDRPRLDTLLEDDLRGLLFSKGKYWATARSAVFPLFHAKDQLDSYMAAMSGAIHKTEVDMSRLAGEKPFNLLQVIQELTLDVFSRVFFGSPLEGAVDQEAAKMVTLVDKLVASLSQPHLVSLVCLFTGPKVGMTLFNLLAAIPGTAQYERLRNGHRRMQLGRQLANTRSREVATGDGATKVDILLQLMRAQERAQTDDTRVPLTNDDLAMILSELVFAGSETTANTLTCAVYLLCTHPEVEAKLLAEINANVRDFPPTSIANLEKYQFAEMVVKETMRLYPSAALMFREAEEDVRVGRNEEWLIPQGASICIPICAMDRSPANFHEPEAFIPERFDPGGSEGKKDPRPHAFIPFGQGPRMCIGYKLAMQEACLVLVELYSRFQFTLPPGSKLTGLRGKEAVAALEMRPGLIPGPKGGLSICVSVRK